MAGLLAARENHHEPFRIPRISGSGMEPMHRIVRSVPPQPKHKTLQGQKSVI